jgi:DNA polymerase-3 subunit delta
VEGAFFLFGDAPHQRDEAARLIIEHALDPAARELNLDRYNGHDVDADTLAAALHTPPMFGDRRVVLVTEAQKLSTAAVKVVDAVLESLPGQLTFVLSAGPASGKAEKTLKRFAKRCRSFEWRVPKLQELPGWLLVQAKSRFAFELTEEAAQAVADAIGPELGILDSELRKLAEAAEAGIVDLETVRRLVPNVREVNRWEWLDQVANREYEAAVSSLAVLLSDSRESAVGLLAAMIDQHICMGIALEGGSGLLGRTLGEVGKPYLRWKARMYEQQSRHWRAPEIDRALELMRQADWQTKSGIGDRAALEELLLSLRLERLAA